MAVVIGKNAKFGVRKEATYGTGVAVTSLLTFVSEDLVRNITQVQNQYLDGTSSIPDISNTTREVSGSVTLEGVYDEISGDIIGIDDVIFAALGSGSYNSTSGYAEYSPADELDVSYTLAVLKGDKVFEFTGAKVSELEISNSAGNTLQISVTWICQNGLITGETGIVNTSGTLSGLSPSNFPKTIRFDQLIARIDTVGASLSSADQVCLNEYTITINNNLTEASFCTPENGEDPLLTLEPVRNGRREVTFSVTFPRFINVDEFTWHSDETEVQCDLKYSNGSKNFNIYLPRLRVTSATANIGGAGIVPKTVEFMALRNNGVNANMTFTGGGAIVEEIGIETKNARTAIPS